MAIDISPGYVCRTPAVRNAVVRKQRTVNPLVVPARNNFLYSLKAGPAGGLRPPSGPAATRRSPGTGLTLIARVS
jgi:hypothetical protein